MTTVRNAYLASCIVLCLSMACGESKQEPAPAPSVTPATNTEVTAAEPAPPVASPGPTLEDPADPNEACGRIVVVSFTGAEHAPEGMQRDKAAAQTRAAELLKNSAAHSTPEEFAALAKSESDAPGSAPRGGVMGTFTKDAWPELHAALKDAVFALKVNETAAQPIETPYGFVILQRCKVDKRHARHVLVRYKGAKKAGPEIKRSQDDAKKRAVEAQQKLSQGAAFDDIVKQYSEDASKDRGGDIGSVGRGLLAPAFEDALFGLKVGELSTVVETDFGFHVIQRLPDEAPAPK
jgi:peptidyl-prolyl cis-trans isomerase SurA